MKKIIHRALIVYLLLAVCRVCSAQAITESMSEHDKMGVVLNELGKITKNKYFFTLNHKQWKTAHSIMYSYTKNYEEQLNILRCVEKKDNKPFNQDNVFLHLDECGNEIFKGIK